MTQLRIDGTVAPGFEPVERAFRQGFERLGERGGHDRARLLGDEAVRRGLPAEAIFDWDRIVHALERAEPWWPPGTRIGEQADFFGHLVGEIVRRVDGRTLGTFLRQEVTEPLGLDFQIGLGPDDGRGARRCMRPNAAGAIACSVRPARSRSRARQSAGAARPRRRQRVCMAPRRDPSGERARFGASRRQVHAALSEGGTLGGIRILGGAMVREMAAVQSSGTDVLVGPGVSWGLGVGVDESGFGMGGLGGSYGGGDLARRWFAYVTATMADHDRVDLVADAFEACVDAADGG